MSHHITRHPDHTVEISAELDAESVEQERQAIVKEMRRHARIPGFRPGKAPVSAVRTRYASEIKEDLTDRLATVLWQKILKEEDDFHPLTQPKVEDLGFGEDGTFSFRATLEIRPQFDLPEIEGLELPDHPIDVTDGEIESELERVAEENAAWAPAPEGTAVADGMMVEVDLTVAVKDSEDEPKTEENARIEVGSDGIPKEISEALQGAVIGDRRSTEIVFTPDEDADNTTPQTMAYTLDVRAVKIKTVPEIDDTLAEEIGLENLETLKERIREVLGRQKEAERRDRRRRFVLDHLEGGIDAESLPPSLIKDAVNADMQRFVYDLAMRGQNPEGLDYQELWTKLEPAARRRVLDTLVLEQLADEWNLEVPEHDVDAYIAGEAQKMRIPPAEHKANLAKENRLEGLRHAALMAHTVSEMLRRAGAEGEDE